MFRESGQVKLNPQVTGLISFMVERNFHLLISKVSDFTFTLSQVVYAALTEL